MQSKRFQKCPEDFTCLHCGVQVAGNGFTNHCPECLWSKHVDVHPGDRAASCGGSMEPVGLEYKQPMRVIHRCQVCGFIRPNKVTNFDRREALYKIASGSQFAG